MESQAPVQKKRVCLGLFPVSEFEHVKMGTGYPRRKAERWSNVHIKRTTGHGKTGKYAGKGSNS